MRKSRVLFGGDRGTRVVSPQRKNFPSPQEMILKIIKNNVVSLEAVKGRNTMCVIIQQNAESS